MKQIETTIHSAKTNFSRLIAMLERRDVDRILIKRRSEIVGELKVYNPQDKSRILGIAQGQFTFNKMDLDRAAKEAAADFDRSRAGLND